jgi:putative spermidine/putrescine transport system substrate-binding protein
VYGGFYAQGVVKDSPHQACSKLWLEHILGNDGALGYLQGGAMPARYEALVEADLVADADKTNLPPDELISQVEFLTPAQIADAAALLGENWGPMVADA